MTNDPDLLLLGRGNMGAAPAAGLLARLPRTRILTLDPDPDRARSLLPAYPSVVVRSDPAALAGAPLIAT